MTVRAPEATAARTCSPTPRVSARQGARRPPGSRPSPLDSASSTSAVRPSTAYVASTGSPVGPLTGAVRRSQPAARSAATVPSPPSPIGADRTSRVGSAARRPAARWAATEAASRDPLNESGASRTERGRLIRDWITRGR